MNRAAEYIEYNFDDCVGWASKYLPSKLKDHARDVVIDVWESLKDRDINIKNSARTFVFSCIRNRTLNYVRDELSREGKVVDKSDLIENDLFSNTQAYDPYDIIEANEDLSERVNSLSPLLKETMRAIYDKGDTPEEVAKRENLSVDVIYKRIERVKKTIRGEKHVR